MVTIREDIRLAREIGSTRIYQVHARKAILHGYLLRSQMFLHRNRVVSASFDRGIIGNYDTLGAENSQNK